MAMPDSPTLSFRLQREVSRSHMPWVADAQCQPLSCLCLPAQQCSYVECGPQHSPDAHGVLHPGLLFISHLGYLPPAAVPPSLKQMQGCHSLETGVWVILSWKLLIHIVLIVLICFHCTGMALWLGPCHQPPEGPMASNPRTHLCIRHGP